MPTLASYPTPAIVRETFAGGFAAGGAALLTFDELSAYDGGKGRGAERLFKCPFCGGSERAFHVNSQTGRFNCKRSSCGVKGILREFWRDTPQPSGRANRQAQLKKAFGLDAPKTREAAAPVATPTDATAQNADASNWRAQWESAVALESPSAQPGRDYLSRRGVCLQTAIRAGVRFCRNWAPSPDGKIYRGGAAILFPLRDALGALQAVNGRYLAPDANPKARSGGTLGAGAFWAAPSNDFDWQKCDALGTVEGPFDALALGACGAAALAFCGVNLPAWFGRAVAFKAVAIGSDADDAGEVAAANWARDFGVYTRRVSRLRAPDGLKDFGEGFECFGRDWLTAWLRENAGELLTAPEAPAPEPATVSPFRANAFVFVPAKVEPAPGAAKICKVLQNFRSLFAAARGGELPTSPFFVSLDGQKIEVESAAACVLALESEWTRHARRCQREKRDLTTPEAAALEAGAALLDQLAVRWDGETWRELEAMSAQLDKDFAAAAVVWSSAK